MLERDNDPRLHWVRQVQIDGITPFFADFFCE
jgi:hypothetical protein